MSLLHVVGEMAQTLHIGGLLIFAILLGFRRAIPHLRDEDLVRVFRSWGAGFGLSLGALMATGIARQVMEVGDGGALPGSLGLRFDEPLAMFVSLRSLALFAMWVSYIRLEVWTVQPCRSLDKDGVIADPAAYAAATSALARHLSLNALLGLLVVIFGALADRAWGLV